MKRQMRRLTLNRELVIQLAQLSEVRGGAPKISEQDPGACPKNPSHAQVCTVEYTVCVGSCMGSCAGC
jgi:hypothetical protein